jgi:hypothetical protein
LWIWANTGICYNAHLADLAVPKWQATLDALQELPEIGATGPVGYFGLNMGTAIGVPLVAIEPRITAARSSLWSGSRPGSPWAHDVCGASPVGAQDGLRSAR